MKGYLRIRAEGTHYGLRVDQVLEVVDGFELRLAPATHESVRGVTPLRGRLIPVVQLAALLGKRPPPPMLGGTAVLARCSGSLVAFEVDDAEELVAECPLPVPDAWRLPWASGVGRFRGDLIPIIDLEILAGRLMPEHEGIGE